MPVLPSTTLLDSTGLDLLPQYVQESQLLYLPYVFLHVACMDTNVTDKSTWWGCGNHISTVMDDIPDSDRCTCTPQVDFEGKKYPPKAANAP